MSYFVVTEGLRERLLASGAARIINTASAAHQGATLDFDDLQSANSFGAMRAYSRSKLCNILFTRELARRLHGTDVTVNCLRPSFVATRFADESGGLVSHLAWLAKFSQYPPPKRSNDHLSRVLTRGGHCDRKILLQVSSDYAVGTRAGRSCCFGVVAAQCGFSRYEGIARAFVAYLSCRRTSMMRLASATISSERLFSRSEGLSAIARVEPGAKIAALQPFPTGLTSIRNPLYSIVVIACHETMESWRLADHPLAGAFFVQVSERPTRALC